MLDTKVTTPFFKSKFPKYANKESAFLTLATRERVKWTKEEGQALKIRDRELKKSFLNIFERIETGKINPKLYLEYLLFQLINLSKTDAVLFKKMEMKVSSKKILNINLVINMLSEHFGCRLSSRLPVIAIYSIYEILLNCFERYKDKQLISLHVHTSSDKHSFGDIEIYTKMNIPFEIVEIKHNIPIDKYLVFDIARKTENTNIDRYYILTTLFKGIFRNKSEEEEVFKSILHFRRLRDIDIIANGIISTLRYYLRFVDEYGDFLKIYTKNLVIDAENSTEVKGFHLDKWREIREKYI
jgi:DNA (cytosine-5)-methyltransferase 1